MVPRPSARRERLAQLEQDGMDSTRVLEDHFGLLAALAEGASYEALVTGLAALPAPRSDSAPPPKNTPQTQAAQPNC